MTFNSYVIHLNSECRRTRIIQIIDTLTCLRTKDSQFAGKIKVRNFNYVDYFNVSCVSHQLSLCGVPVCCNEGKK